MTKVAASKAIEFMWSCEKEILQEVSPRTAKYRSYAKMPLVTLVGLTGALSGLSVAVIKCSTELIKTEGGLSVTSIGLFALGGFSATLEMFGLNIAMKYYSQLEVVPIFETSYTVMNLLFGMILLNEAANYMWY